MRFLDAEITSILEERKQQFRVPTGLPATRFNPTAKTHTVLPVAIDLSTGKPIEVEPFARLRVVSLRVEPLALVTPADVKREGYKRPEQLWRAFLRRWQIREYDAPEIVVHVVDFEIDRAERPKFMARQQGILNPPQYVENEARAIDDAEVMDPALLSPEWKQKGLANYIGANSNELRRRADRARIERLRAHVSTAAKQGIPVDDELAEIDKAIKRLGEKVESANELAADAAA